MKKKGLLLSRAREPVQKSLQPLGLTRTLADFAAVYRAAARKLAGSGDSGSLENLPILFLYRHAVEIAIKAVLIEAGEPESKVLRRGHDLNDQMPDLRKVAERQRLPISAHFEDMIKRWKEGDPDGMKARYPTDKRGKPVLISNETRFRLRPFVEDAEQMLDELTELLEDLDFDEYRKIISRETSN